ncbi:MAG: hypothetical protein JSU82_17950 [Rhodospirillales bacterium]|nr:MAG: hypothetical protein JSU82_17950 [Rhodospirillales bacterium]
MNIENKPPQRRGGARRIASDMSEAVSYLIGVALSAGLGGVARKLNDVNAELQCMQRDPGEDEASQQQTVIKH